MILFNILIFSFGFWNIFKESKGLSKLFGMSFIASFGYWLYTSWNSSGQMDTKVTQGVIMMLGLSILGYLLMALSKNKIAQIGAVVMAALGLNLFITNPHTPLDSSVPLDTDSELIVRIDHDTKTKTENKIKKLDFVKNVRALLAPLDTESTELDDYYAIDVKNKYDINIAISELSQINGVEWIEPNETYQLNETESKTLRTNPKFAASVNDPMAVTQWNMEALKMQDFYPLFENSKFKPKRTAKLFILDSGVNADHEDININFQRHPSKDHEANESDENGHGTHCAGIASAISNNGKGIASMSPGSDWVTVSSVKVMNKFGIGSQTRIIEGIIEAVDGGADVISMSLGGRSSQLKEEAYRDALAYADRKNVIIIAAAGNNAGDASKIVPANSEIVITVTALDRDLKKAQFSNYITNTNYGIAAPGTSIPSSWKGGKYATLDGTSMAAPHVSGLVAVMKSLNPKLKTKQVFEILSKTGTDTKENHLTGKMINPTAAVKAVL